MIESAAFDGSSVVVQGVLSSKPNSFYSVEFFVSPECNPSGFGEGFDYIGQFLMITDAAGNAPFDLTLTAGTPAGLVISATAMEVGLGNTSEFSLCIPIGSGCIADMTGDGEHNISDVIAFLTVFSTLDPAADMAAPFGVFDFSDVVTFLSGFGAGCP